MLTDRNGEKRGKKKAKTRETSKSKNGEGEREKKKRRERCGGRSRRRHCHHHKTKRLSYPILKVAAGVKITVLGQCHDTSKRRVCPFQKSCDEPYIPAAAGNGSTTETCRSQCVVMVVGPVGFMGRCGV